MSKRMTLREKKARAAVRKRLREQGVLPPCKKPLNRKRFIDETITAFNERDDKFDIVLKMKEAVSYLCGDNVKTQENVGAVKVLRLAMDMTDFEKRLKAEGRDTYTIGEYYDQVLEPVLSL